MAGTVGGEHLLQGATRNLHGHDLAKVGTGTFQNTSSESLALRIRLETATHIAQGYRPRSSVVVPCMVQMTNINQAWRDISRDIRGETKRRRRRRRRRRKDEIKSEESIEQNVTTEVLYKNFLISVIRFEK